MGKNKAGLPPGFRFCPTDEELVVHFLKRNPSLLPYHPDIIPDLHLYPYDPWELDGKAMVEGRKWYYYSRKTHKRMTESGYWKAYDEEEIISNGDGGERTRIGVKKSYAFHMGEEGIETSWKMEEFRVVDATAGTSKRRPADSKKDHSKRVICRVFQHDDTNSVDDDEDSNDGVELSCLDEAFLSMDDFDDVSFPY